MSTKDNDFVHLHVHSDFSLLGRVLPNGPFDGQSPGTRASLRWH